MGWNVVVSKCTALTYHISSLRPLKAHYNTTTFTHSHTALSTHRMFVKIQNADIQTLMIRH